MGDTEAVFTTHTSTVMEYTSSGHPSEYGGSHTIEASDTDSTAVGVDGDLPTSTAPAAPADSVAYIGNMDAANLGSESVYISGLESAKEDTSSVDVNDNSENVTGMTNTSADLSQVSTYGSSVNGNDPRKANGIALAGISENGNPSDDDHGSNSMNHQPVDDSALSAEEERLWSIVKTNSLDFNAWIALIDQTAVDHILKIRKVYDAFLAEFPLCYGYWKKYADHEARLGSIEKVVEVYERAVQGVTYSVEMWVHYCEFAINTYGDPETVRRLFERGLTYVGADYLSHQLWDKYIEYEYTQQDWSRIAQIYTRILENPIQQLDRFFNGFKELVATRPLSELRTAEETAAAASVENSEGGSHETHGEVHLAGMEQSTKPVSASLIEAEELEKYIAVREEMHKKAKEFDFKIIGFETAIRRPYFHVRPLDGAELENWHNYLDFIEAEGDFNKIMKLYERCLIACANYPEYWIRYVLFMEAGGSTELSDNALARATQLFVKRQPEIHLFAARFGEQRGDIDGARAAYQLVHTEISPGLLEAIIKHANMERRLGNLEDACSLYEQTIAIEKGKEQSQTLPLLFAQYSRFLCLVADKVDKARDILQEALEYCPLSKPLLEAFIHLESILPLPKRIDYLESLVEKFLVPTIDSSNAASNTERKELSSIFLEFLDLFGDMQTIKKADDRHAKFFLPHKSAAESKKRHAEDFLVSDRAKLARSGVNSSTPSVMGAYPSGQNQWPASYGSHSQAWPQATQAQGQQWTPGYAQQAAYSAYSSYGSNYMNVQAQPSVSQTAAYGAYPPTYPAQAVPQQNYLQPAAAAATTATALAPTQPTSVPPPAYYGSYY